MSSAFIKNNIVQKEISFRKDIFERVYKKVDDFNYLTLSHYFLKEEELLFKLMDSKRQEEVINEKKEKNRNKY
jgi:hypothetical protein